jgi:hypothetical protein
MRQMNVCAIRKTGEAMPSHELLITRIRGEYDEMPGLRLTFAQACRLWQLDPPTCDKVLHSLLDENFLARTATGSFVRASAQHVRPAPIKVDIGYPVPRTQLRRPA